MTTPEKLPIGWTATSVGRLADFRNGSAFNEDDWASSGLPIIRIQNLNGGSDFNYFQGDPSRHVVVETGDLLFSWSGNRGTSFGPFIWHGSRGVLNQHIFKVIGHNGISQDFLLHALRRATSAIEKRAHGGTGIVHVRKSELEKFVVPLPPKCERDAIVGVLAATDDAIERTREVIDQTRRLKTALLQDLLTNGLPGNRNGHQIVRWLGKAPKSWNMFTLGDLVREPIRNGHSPNCPSRPTGHWVLSLSAVSVEGYRPSGVKPAPPNDPKVLDSQLMPGDILVSRSNTRALVGLAGAYDGTPSDCSYPDLLMRVRVDHTKANPDYILAVLLSGGSRSYFSQTSRGTSGSMKKIDKKILETLPVPLPSPEEQNEIVRINDAMSRRVADEVAFIERAENLKNALSQALLTGRVRVPTAAALQSP